MSSHPDIGARLAMDGFLPNDLLASLLDSGLATRRGCTLTSRDGKLYVLQDAVRILGITTGQTDPFGMTGLVQPLAELLRRGFVISAERVAFGRHLYDVEFGVLAFPFHHDPDQSGVNPAIRDDTG